MTFRPRLNRFATLVWLIGLSVSPVAAQVGSSGDEKDKDPPASPAPPDGEPAPDPTPFPEFRLRGGERLAWDQPAASSDALTGLTFRAYVNGTLWPLDDAGCNTTSPGPDGFECQASLPPLEPGLHTVSVVALAPDGFSEGPASSPIVLRVETTGSNHTAATTPPVSRAGRRAAPAAGPEAAALLARGLVDPTDLAALPDGRLLVAERSGRIRVFRDGHLLLTPALSLPDVVVGQGRGLLALAADRQFAATQAVFLLYSTPDGLRLTRYRLSGDTLIDRAVILDGLPASDVQPRALVRMGPDGQLYVALDDGGVAGRSADLGDLAGKVLRLAPDGTTPADQPPGPPIYMTGLHRPTGLAWGPDSDLWVADLGAEGVPHLLHAAAGPATGTRTPRARFAMPASPAPHTLAAEPLSSDVAGTRLLVTHGPPGASLLRVAFDAGGQLIDAAWLPADGADTALGAMAVGADGAVYACVADTLVRLALDRP